MDKAITGGLIDRRSLVGRHNPVVSRIDPFSALSVGNGRFAFTGDVTGLQTFPESYRNDFPLCTTSEWAWHSSPLPGGIDESSYRFKDYDSHGRAVGYATDSTGQEVLFNWLRENPHRFHLGRIGLEMTRAEGAVCAPEDLAKIDQRLDLWSGLIDSAFEIQGAPVRVRTCCHPDLDLLAVRIESPLVEDGRLRVVVAFGYGSPSVEMVEWAAGDKHQTRLNLKAGRADLSREMDRNHYTVGVGWKKAKFSQRKAHEFVLEDEPANDRGPKGVLEFVVAFSPDQIPRELPDFPGTQAASAAHWEKFWTEGGAIDLSGSTADSAPELERRIVLSQYVTALNCASSMPAAETGLLFNSWYGKFHLEMHWWHSVHFSVWNRFELFDKSMGYYQRILPMAQANAKRQGYRGARWPKMVGPEGRDSPSPVAPLLIWQQPHPLYYAEVCYRHRPGEETLQRWRDIVFETANFMANFAVEVGGRLVLGPPMKTVSENTDPRTSTNPTFELTYWRFGLRVAQSWRERMGLARDVDWDRVLSLLAKPATGEGRYLMQEGMTDTYGRWNWEHPALMGALGMQPGDGIDAQTMRRSVQKVMACWQWERAWGWDFPMMAMAAARAGEPDLAVKALMIEVPKNRYHPNGHNYQRPGLTAYLPGNGGLLAATAMMAAGWTGSSGKDARGFPNDGSWRVRSENLGIWM